MKISKNYAIDVAMFYKYRNFSDGIDFINFETVYDKYIADHNPSFGINFIILNFMILYFRVYNIHHIKESNSINIE